MYTIYKLRADELDERFLDTLKHQFQDREIEIVVSEPSTSLKMRRHTFFALPPIASGCCGR